MSRNLSASVNDPRDRENLEARRDLLLVMLQAARRPQDVIRACAEASGGPDSVVSKIAEFLQLSRFGAEVVARMDVAKFSPYGVRNLEAELLDVETKLSASSRN